MYYIKNLKIDVIVKRGHDATKMEQNLEKENLFFFLRIRARYGS